MLRGGRVCVPTPLQERVIYDHHGFHGHVGVQKLWDHMSIRDEWGNVAWALKFAKEVMGVVRLLKPAKNSTHYGQK